MRKSIEFLEHRNGDSETEKGKENKINGKLWTLLLSKLEYGIRTKGKKY